MKRARIGWLVVGLAALTGGLTFIGAAQGWKRPADFAVSSPDGGKLKVCRDGMRFQIAAVEQSPGDPPQPGPFGPYPFKAYHPPPTLDQATGDLVGGSIAAEGEVAVSFRTNPLEIDGLLYYHLGTKKVGWSGGRLFPPGAESLYVDVTQPDGTPGDRTVMFPAYPISDCFVVAKKVKIDIKPGDPLNRLNPKGGGKVKVAILTTSAFKAGKVLASTVRFGLAGTEAPAVTSRAADVDGDGDVDLRLRFQKKTTEILCGSTSAALTGRTADGRRVGGSDVLRTVGC